MIADTRTSWGYSVDRQSRRRGMVAVYWTATAVLMGAFAVTLWSLPQSLVLWNEPDVEGAR